MSRWARASRFVWLVVGLFALSTAAVVSLLAAQFRHNAATGAQRQVDGLARSAEATLNRTLLSIDLTLAGLVQLPGLFTDGPFRVNEKAAPALLRALADQGLLLNDLMLIDASGRLLAAAGEGSANLEPSLPSGFLADVLGQAAPRLLVSLPVSNFRTGEKVIFLARPLGPPGDLRLAAVAVLQVAALSTLLSPAVDLPGLTLTLETDNGVLLASAPPLDALLGRKKALPAAALGSADGSGPALVVGRISDAPSLAAARHTVYASLSVMADLSADAVEAQTREVRAGAIAVALAFAATAVAFGALAQHFLGRMAAATRDTLAAKSVLEEALASMDEGFLLWDAQDRVVSWNERYLHLFPHLRTVMAQGAAFADIARVGAASMLPDGDEAQRKSWIDHRAAMHRVNDQAYEQHLPDGRIVSSVSRRTANGGIVATYRDVTHERAAAEELQRARKKAEAANEAKTRFLATMSHEIRTPLNGVMGMNGLLLATPLDDKQRLYAETARKSGEALLNLVNDILDIAKLEAGRVEIERAPFDPVKLVDEVAELLGAQAQAKGITLDVEHAPALPVLLEGDGGRVRQVIYNLLGNAIKFTSRGGVTVHSRSRRLSDRLVEWTLSVRDSGVGIAAEALPTLFQRFVQADSSTSRRFGGSGLGLAISRELIQLMGGRIEVESQPGQGSEFRFVLPLRPVYATAPRHAEAVPERVTAAKPAGDPAQTAAAPPSAPQPPQGLRILVVEDNRVNQILTTAMLSHLGHFADVAADGREAVAQVQQVDYDLVLMDIQMPEMDGLTATRLIRGLPGKTGRVPIISVSANVFPQQRAACLAAGMNDHVSKPVDLSVLQATIAAVMRQA